MSDMLCPACGYRMDTHEAFGSPATTPKPEDFALCLSCGELLTFDDGGGFTAVKCLEAALDHDPQTIALVKRTQTIIRGRGRIEGAENAVSLTKLVERMTI